VQYIPSDTTKTMLALKLGQALFLLLLLCLTVYIAPSENMTRIKGTLYEDIYANISLNSKVVEKIKSLFMFSDFLLQLLALYEIMRKKYGRTRQARDDNMTHAHCMLGN
jgi:hypothetical protein